MPEHVSFVIPCVDGTQILGTANGPVRRTSDGIITLLPQREIPDALPMRWNDAKVAPDGFQDWQGTCCDSDDAHGFQAILASLLPHAVHVLICVVQYQLK
jgi:hypothetical protein